MLISFCRAFVYLVYVRLFASSFIRMFAYALIRRFAYSAYSDRSLVHLSRMLIRRIRLFAHFSSRMVSRLFADSHSLLSRMFIRLFAYTE